MDNPAKANAFLWAVTITVLLFIFILMMITVAGCSDDCSCGKVMLHGQTHEQYLRHKYDAENIYPKDVNPPAPVPDGLHSVLKGPIHDQSERPGPSGPDSKN